jgi:hypothetical protein
MFHAPHALLIAKSVQTEYVHSVIADTTWTTIHSVRAVQFQVPISVL